PPEAVQLRDNSFPALKRLSLRGFFWSHIGVVLGHRLLVKNLVSLELTGVNDGSDSWDDADVALLTLEGIPGLSELTIDFDEHEDYPIDPGDTLANILSQLPLRTVQLVRAQFIGLHEFSQTFPTLTELRMPDQSVDLDDFSDLSTIPNLTCLAVMRWNFGITDLVTNRVVMVCPSLRTLEFTAFWTFGFPIEDVGIVAKYLLKVFPNMERIIWPKKNEETIVPLLNAYVAMLRERNDARARIVEQFGWDVANRLLPDDDESTKPVL
ncbi:hypothetical protein FRC10_000624, partial [Ceratobasidium sp. 414]